MECDIDDFARSRPLSLAIQGGSLLTWVGVRACRAAAYIPSIVLERPVYLRETADGLFKPVIYLTHKILEETVLSVAMALVFSMLVYIIVDLAVTIFSGVILTVEGSEDAAARAP